ncbi:1-deoxyxylulose-5-phosphate synthase YajO-like [Haliotis rubra]|uniref:1-deoxyxylulose-5-phosphate synthase YajO-like n=1 Tax=Haliotis rubra TaxID=36100 RepID=UPI001EE622E4|nr:1-deoxyxylulose-5-phosphate synthase YajO-like [Haliotis rubra]
MAVVPDESKVVYNFLGKSGLKVSNICLGTMTFGENQIGMWGQASEDMAHQILDRYVEWGGNFIDTADAYSSGKSESILGSWLKKQDREKFVIGTKVRFPMSADNPNSVGLSRRHLVKSIQNSLERLQTDYVDLYQMHLWDNATPVEETVRTLDDLVRCGKVRYIGASNMLGWQMQHLVDLTKMMGTNPFISLQQQYSLVSRDSELEAFQVCKANGMGVLPWSPLKAGLLTGKYKRDSRPKEGRIGWAAEKGLGAQAWPAWDSLLQDDQIWNTLDTLEDISKKHGKSMAQVALRWVLQKDIVSSVLIGTTKMTQLEDNMGAANGWKLSPEDMAALDAVSAPKLPYPYEFNTRLNKGRSNAFIPSYTVQNSSF